MNTVFWKPVNPNVNELWSRCAHCKLSAALTQLIRWHHTATNIDLWMCHVCSYQGQIERALLAQGWVSCDR